jgi:hypothetical protein
MNAEEVARFAHCQPFRGGYRHMNVTKASIKYKSLMKTI